LSDSKIRTRSCSDFGDLRELIQQNSKLVPRFGESAPDELPMSTLERCECRRLILRWLTRWRWSRSWADCADCCDLLLLFDPRDGSLLRWRTLTSVNLDRRFFCLRY